MTFLLDVNILIALLDSRHVHNETAHRWAESLGKTFEWASCPIVENAFVRITSSPSYPNSLGSATAALAKLKENCAQTNHRFWPDDFSPRDIARQNDGAMLHSTQVTDCYLLALAVKRGGKLASFDRKIPAQLVRGGRNALHVVQT
jgi:toxin-antitoxin system PIN domain toxin